MSRTIIVFLVSDFLGVDKKFQANFVPKKRKSVSIITEWFLILACEFLQYMPFESFFFIAKKGKEKIKEIQSS